MTYENINFREANMAYHDNYFYFFDDSFDVLYQKVADGDTAFTYPLNSVIGSSILSLEHDGINFWTMQDVSGDAVIKRWRIEGNTVNLKNSLVFTPNFDSEAFTVEHYHTALSTAVSGADTIIETDLYYDTVMSGGSILTLGPNSSDQYEDIEVTSVSAGVQNSYMAGDDVNFYNNLWIFNSYSTGSLHKVDARTGANIATYSSVSYDDVSACTFSRVKNVVPGWRDALVYINDSSLSYLNIDTLVAYDTMTIDTLKPPSTYIKVYDMAIDGNNIYRLQKEARYYGTNYPWPANGVNVSDLSFIVQDQYGDGMINKPVSFTDTDINGFITTTPTFTEYFFGTGEAVSAYKAGLTNGGVTIVGTATQHD